MSAECRPSPYAVPMHIETEKPTATIQAARINQSSICIFLTIHVLVRKRKKTKIVHTTSVTIVTVRVTGALLWTIVDRSAASDRSQLCHRNVVRILPSTSFALFVSSARGTAPGHCKDE